MFEPANFGASCLMNKQNIYVHKEKAQANNGC